MKFLPQVEVIGLITLVACSTAAAQVTPVDTGQKGSLLVLPNVEVRWNSSGYVIQDTFVELTNDAPDYVRIAMLWVNGDPPLPADPGTGERAHLGWNSVAPETMLTYEQPTYWSARAGRHPLPDWQILDPGSPPGRPDPEGSTERVLRGYILIWAVNYSGEQINWNHLSAQATIVHYPHQSAWRYSAHAFQADAAVGSGNAIGTPGTMLLDGVEYEACPDQLLLHFFTSSALLSSAYPTPMISDTDLTLLPMNLDHRLQSAGPTITTARFDVWDMNETHFDSPPRCVTCWDQALLSSYAAPNFFSQPLLTTDMGTARIDALAAGDCPGSSAAPLLAVAGQYVDFAPVPNPQRDVTGAALVGIGAESGVIRFDPPPGQPERQAAEPPAPSSDRAPGLSARAKTAGVGSLLVFPDIELRWDEDGNLKRETFIALNNQHTSDVTVRLHFVSGDEPEPPPERSALAHAVWDQTCGAVELSHHQPTYWSVATGLPAGAPALVDPASGDPPGRPANDGTDDRVLRGFLFAWAVDSNGAEIHWNHLSGHATVVDPYAHTAWSYTPTAFSALDQGGAVGNGDPTGSPFVLHLDGVEFANTYSQLLIKFFAEGSLALSGPSTKVRPFNNLTLLITPADLRAAGDYPPRTRAVFDVWNENEMHFGGTKRCFTWWDQKYLNDYSAPNNFRISVLQTDVGKARCIGLASHYCAHSVSAPLLGVLRTFLTFNTGFAEVGEHVVGAGTDTATILVDPLCGDAFRRPGDIDNDGDVDLYDVAIFQNCFGATPPGYAPGCSATQFDNSDGDEDDDVDTADYNLIQQQLIGPR